MSLFFSDSEAILRAVKEAIPRDWFEEIELTPGNEYVVILNREDGSKRVIPLTEPGSRLAPAIIKAVAEGNLVVLLPAIEQMKKATRLATCIDRDIDSFGFQLYGDLGIRRAGEDDTTIRERIGGLLHSVDEDGKEFFFLPEPTRSGITQFLSLFGYNIFIPPVTESGTIDLVSDSGDAETGWFWWDNNTVDLAPTEKPEARGWNSFGRTIDAVIGLSNYLTAFDGTTLFIFVLGNNDTYRNSEAISLIREAQPLGIRFQIIVTSESSLFS